MTDTDERWLPVVGFEGHYEISDLGRIRSLWIRTNRVNRARAVPHVRATTLHPNGYLGLTICRPGVRLTARIHRLVLEAFTGPCPPGHEAGHLNHIRTDNRLKNLQWITKQENNDQMTRAGRRVYPRGRVQGERHHSAKLNPAKVERATEMFAAGSTFRAIGAELGVHPSSARRAVRGITWRSTR